MERVRWGILSTAKIARTKVIPAMQQSARCDVVALASRDYDAARSAASALGVPTAYGSYEELLADANVQAVYVPLPNHLHVPWSIKALEAGKHVLCEKPIGMDAADAVRLLQTAEANPHLKAMEAFMYRFHPQWQQSLALIRDGTIGELRTIRTIFSYHNIAPENIRNRPETGGGALMDIGCYCISLGRFLFENEPRRVLGVIERDPRFGTDRQTSGILEFDSGTATFTCSTQLIPRQRVEIYGAKGRIEIEIPFNAPPREACRLLVQQGEKTEEIAFPAVDQYTLQGDEFSRAVVEDWPVPTPLSDAVANMLALDAVRESARTNCWASPAPAMRTAS